MTYKLTGAANHLCMLFATFKYMEDLPEHLILRNSSQSEQSTRHKIRSEMLAEGHHMLRANGREVYARTPSPRNPTAAGGNSVLTPRDVSDGLKVLRLNI